MSEETADGRPERDPEEIAEARREALVKLGRFAKFAAPALLGLIAAGPTARAQAPQTQTETEGPPPPPSMDSPPPAPDII